ncbi:unnamed protein product, partial [Brugia timori]|uniref:CCHC-type domain-containing protein n=1 Tax=Brugia timori TaxID=42155 RepID=A0A0R3QU08_9BILA
MSNSPTEEINVSGNLLGSKGDKNSKTTSENIEDENLKINPDNSDEIRPDEIVGATPTKHFLFCEANSEVIQVLDQYCPKQYLTGIKNKLNKSLSRFEFHKVLSFSRALEKLLQKKHQKRKPITDFISVNSELYQITFNDLESTEQIETFSLEDFDTDFCTESQTLLDFSVIENITIMAPPNESSASGISNPNATSITNFAIAENQKIAHDKAAKYVRIDFPGGKNSKTLLRTFLKQCENAIKLCKTEDLNLLYLNLTTHITGEAQVMLEDLNFDNWDDIVQALKNKYGEPETFSQRLYNFLTTAKIRQNESTADFGERISHLLSRSIESLADEPTLKDASVSDFLQHLGKIFFVEQGNQNIAQYLRLYCKDYSADLQKLIREGATEEQKLKGYGNNTRPKDFKNFASSSGFSNVGMASANTSNKSPQATNLNNNRKNSKTGKWCYWHANDSHDTKECRVAPTCEKCKFKGHLAADCRTKIQKIRKMEANTSEQKSDKNWKPQTKPTGPTRPCRMCKNSGHYDADCPEFIKFQEFQKKSVSKNSDEVRDYKIHTLKIKKEGTAILRSVQSENNANEDVFLKLHSTPWNRKYLFQLDNAAQVSVVKKSKVHRNTDI